MDFLQLLDIPILNLITNIGNSLYCFFAYFGELLQVELINNSLPADFLNLSVYSPFTETYVQFNYTNVMAELSNTLATMFNLLLGNTTIQFTYFYEVLLFMLPGLAILFFVIGIVKNLVS